MKIYDISQEVFTSEVFPGDPAPHFERILSVENGDVCNLTEFGMCAHNGTHIDAPFHFIKDGTTVESIPLEAVIGRAYVYSYDGVIDGTHAREILNHAEETDPESAKRILLKGKAVVSADAARVFAQSGVLLVGNESQTVGPEDAPMEVHLELLGNGVVLLEGIRLGDVPAGAYLLSAAPLKLGGADGAPVRAVLIEL